MTPSPSSQQGLEPRRPRSGHTQTVSVNIAESTPPNGNRRFQLHVSECVETKTVTTTTRLTRKFPQVFIRDPAPLESLDTKEYPLATKPTPPELADFSYSFGAEEEDFDADMMDDVDDHNDSQLVSGRRNPMSVDILGSTLLTNLPFCNNRQREARAAGLPLL